MKNPYLVAGLAFGAGSISQLVLGNYFAALATGTFAAGLLLPDFACWPTLAKPVAGIWRSWRNITALVLVMVSIGLFGYDIGRALYHATHHATAATHTK